MPNQQWNMYFHNYLFNIMNTLAGFNAITPHYPKFMHKIIHKFSYPLPQNYVFQTELSGMDIEIVLYQLTLKIHDTFEISQFKESNSLEDIQDALDGFWSFYLNSPDQPWNIDPE
ncbi:hypothetical protein C2G38_2049063 [Gigaspora rosea]|uniref:Uncharacterized protein n=1 Tax=Gigaspora rosea TaxID=44941 RepID=A0A397U0C6_9GLOM|nr:hypothetical protein C2G38_2049063 [Gigaspora rosea]